MADLAWNEAKSKRAVWTGTTSVGIHVLGHGMLIPVLPNIIRDVFFNGDTSAASYFNGVNNGFGAALELFSNPALGSLSDRWGRRPVYLFALCGGLLGSILTALSIKTASLWLFILSGVIGSLTAVQFATTYTMMADVGINEGEAAASGFSKRFGLIGVAFGMGFSVGPITGGLLSKVHALLPFGIFICLGFVNILFVQRFLPETLMKKGVQFKLNGLDPFSSLGLLVRTRFISSLSVVNFLKGIANGVHTTFMLYTRERYGWEGMKSGAFMSLVGILAIVWHGIGIRIFVPMLGERRVIVWSLVCSSISTTLYGVASKGWQLYAICIAFSFGWMEAPAMRSVLSRQIDDPAEQGRMQGGIGCLMTISRVIGPFLMNTTFGYFVSDKVPVKIYGAAFFLAGALSFLSLAIVVMTFLWHPETDATVRSNDLHRSSGKGDSNADDEEGSDVGGQESDPLITNS